MKIECIESVFDGNTLQELPVHYKEMKKIKNREIDEIVMKDTNFIPCQRYETVLIAIPPYKPLSIPHSKIL